MRVRLKSPWRRILVIFIVSCLLYVGYGYWNFYGDPGSMFYDERKAFQPGYSQFRRQESEQVIYAWESFPHAFIKASAYPRFCAAFIAEKREGEQYIKTAVSSALQGLANEERENLLVNVQFSHTDPTIHPNWNDTWLEAATDSVHTYDVSPELFAHLQLLEARRAFREKSVVDYTEAMQRCYDSGADWVVIFEDDVILANGWFAHLYDAVLQIEELHRDSISEWVYLRLFDREKSLAWGPHGKLYQPLLILAIAGPVAILIVALRFVSDRFRRTFDNKLLVLICLVIIPTVVVLFFKTGKSSIYRPTTGVHEQEFGCCAQGLVFPRKMVPRLRGYLRDRERGWIDLLINDFASKDRMDFVRYALYPIQMQHIGKQSVHGSDPEDEARIRNAAFERLDPKTLERKHSDLVEVLYPE